MKGKEARAALESSSKRGSSDRISNRQEFWSIEMGHLTYNNGNRGGEKESTFRHQTFDF